MQIIIINSTKNENVGIVEMPKNASSLFHKIMCHRALRATRQIKKSVKLSTFLIKFKKENKTPCGINATRLPTLGFDKRNKFTLIVYLRDPYKRFVSGLYEELVYGEIEIKRSLKKPDRQILTRKLLEENFANVDFNVFDHTVLQSSLVTLGLKYCNYDFFYNPESLDVIVEKYNICKAEELKRVNAFVDNVEKSYFTDWMHSGILEKNKDIIYKYLKPDYDLLDSIKTKLCK